MLKKKSIALMANRLIRVFYRTKPGVFHLSRPAQAVPPSAHSSEPWRFWRGSPATKPHDLLLCWRANVSRHG